MNKGEEMTNWSEFLTAKQNNLVEIQNFSHNNSADSEEYMSRVRPLLLALLQLQ
jgi:hypothetical protein